jgi:cyclophilin family peptidyl-prolyl cis-trans isomerase
MPKMLKSLAALFFVPMLLTPLAGQAQDAAPTEQTARGAERAARDAAKAEEKAREQQEKDAAQLEKQREKDARAAEKAAAKETKAAERSARKAAKETREAAEEASLSGETAAATSVVAAVPELPAPDKADPDNILFLDLSTGGRVAIQLYPEIAPKHVERIKLLARQGFYDGIIFHRVIEGFMAQTGDPTGTGTGGSDLPDVAAEFNKFPHLRGSVSMARAQDPDSANSQFFIVFYPRFALDNSYTNFGRVFSGMQYVDAIPRGEPPTEPARILQASLKTQNKPEPNYAAMAQPAAPAISVDDLNAPITN